MLKQRIITALLLAIAFIGVLFYVPSQYFAIIMALVVIVGAWEWAGLSGFSAPKQRAFYVGITILLLWGTYQYMGVGSNFSDDAIRTILMAGCSFWALALLLVQGYPSSAILWGARLSRAAMGLIVLLSTWVSIVYIHTHEQGAWLVLLLIGVVAAADSGGYFVGRKFGQRKLAPSVSPGKTWEGFAGGLGANLLLCAILTAVIGWSWWYVALLIIPASLVSVLGDLLESMLKRHAGLKDSGTLLPGHGGVLDRVDGITAAAPVFALALFVLNSGAVT